MAAIARHYVFTFDRDEKGQLNTPAPEIYASAEEAEAKAKTLAPLHAGVLILVLTIDQETQELLETKVTSAVGEFSMEALIKNWGDW
jgi:hypothetical protein